jgi:BlaI family transcriptional regulator, penicillinase repressor
MARPKHEHPTPGELEVLKILWDEGPLTVRNVLEVLNRRRRRAYTSVMSLMNVMADKGLLKREPQGRAFLYRAAVARNKTVGRMLRDLLGRAFEGSATALVAQLLNHAQPSPHEMQQIRQLLDAYQDEHGDT